jgi:hypothetical protein
MDFSMAPLEADLYMSDLGRTLLLQARQREQLLTLKAIFEDLGAGRRAGLDLSMLFNDGVVTSFRAEVDDAQSRYRRSLKLQEGKDGPELRWVRAQDDWQTTALLVGALIEAEGPGHQYLTDEGLDDVVVCLSFREY